MRPASRTTFRLLLISEDPQLIAAVHALEHRPARTVQNGETAGFPSRSVEVTFVSSLVSALTSVEAAAESNRPFELAVIDRDCTGIREVSVVRELWEIAPELCLIDCEATDPGVTDPGPVDVCLSLSSPPRHGKRFRLPRSIENDQLAELIDTLMDGAALRLQSRAMRAEISRLGSRVDELEDQNQSLSEQVARLRLKQNDRYRNTTSIRLEHHDDAATGIEERRCHGPSVRRVTVACEPAKAESERQSGRLPAGVAGNSGSRSCQDESDESRLTGVVLVADDVPGNRRLARFLLEQAGATVVTADSGSSLDARFSELVESRQHIGAIVLHMGMREVDGYVCARRLRERGYSGPIIAATSGSLPIDRHLCVSAGCDELVTLPLDRNQFIRTVRRMLHSMAGERQPVAPNG